MITLILLYLFQLVFVLTGSVNFYVKNKKKRLWIVLIPFIWLPWSIYSMVDAVYTETREYWKSLK